MIMLDNSFKAEVGGSVGMNELGALVPAVGTYLEIYSTYGQDLAVKIAQWVNDATKAINASNRGISLSEGFAGFLVGQAQRLRMADSEPRFDITSPQDYPKPQKAGESSRLLGALKREICGRYGTTPDIRKIFDMDQCVDLSPDARLSRFGKLQNLVLGR